MKTTIILLLAGFLASTSSAQIVVCFTTADDQNPDNCNYEYCSSDNAPFTFSKGRYRIPYEEFVSVHVTNDHIKHCPRGAIDMSGIGDNGVTFNVVAAADGWIRAISDSHAQSCPDGGCDNNYVWIEHPNGEWTKYTHVAYHSASSLHNEDDWVTAGTIIGVEGSVGISTGPHCHFEVAVPVDTNTLLFDEGGGWINENWADNLVPLFCNVPGNVMESGEEYTAVACASGCDAFLPVVNTTYSGGQFKAFIGDEALSNTHDILFDEASAGVIQSGSSVTLTPGFQAIYLSNFEVRIGNCSGAGFQKSFDVVQHDESKSDFSLSPNPASSLTVLSWTMISKSHIRVSICDMERRELIHVADMTAEAGTHQYETSLSSLTSGMYLVVLQSDKRVEVCKLIVQR